MVRGSGLLMEVQNVVLAIAGLFDICMITLFVALTRAGIRKMRFKRTFITVIVLKTLVITGIILMRLFPDLM